MRLRRSLLFTPGNNEQMIRKASTRDADVLVLDLEDSVPPEEKSNARMIVQEALKNLKGQVFVRVNALSTEWIKQDLEAAVGPSLTGIVLPKVNFPEDIAQVAIILEHIEKSKNIAENATEILPILETASGVWHAYQISRSNPRVKAVTFGAGDFTLDMGINWTDEGTELFHARSGIVLAAVAAGVHPLDSVWANLEDDEGFVRDTELGKRIGYKGRPVIHPKHIPIVNKVFTPSAEETRWAKDVVEAFEAAMAQGKGACRYEGKMIDVMHYHRAQNILKTLHAIEERQSRRV